MSRLLLNPSTINWGDEHAIGDIFEVEVRITDVLDCYGVQFAVIWDSSVLELVNEPSKGNFLEGAGITTWWFPSFDVGYAYGGYIRYEAPSGVNISSPNSGLVATLKFKALKKPGETELNFVDSDCFWFDSGFNIYSFSELGSASFSFGILKYPKIVIVNITAPSKALASEVFEVNTDWRNDGGQGIAWIRLLDSDTKLELSPKTEFQVKGNSYGTIKHTVIMPNRNLRLRVEIGHVES